MIRRELKRSFPQRITSAKASGSAFPTLLIFRCCDNVDIEGGIMDVQIY